MGVYAYVGLLDIWEDSSQGRQEIAAINQALQARLGTQYVEPQGLKVHRPFGRLVQCLGR